MTPLTQEYLKEYFDYNSETGDFFRIKRVNNSCKLNFANWGKINGYMTISVDKHHHLVHRLIWLWIYGYTPVEIDHINGKRSDNRLINLRSVTHSQNTRNQKRSCRNTSGTTGVHWNKNAGKWQAQITLYKKKCHLGYYKDICAAIVVRKKAEIEMDFHPNHGRQESQKSS